MTSSRPYLLRAFYDWILDNDFTPYIVIDTLDPDVTVPQEYVENGRIVLNISPVSIEDLLIANDHLGFNARFGGVPYCIYSPISSIEAIYAKENGRGMVFKDEDDEDDEPPPPPKDRKSEGSGGSDSKGGKSKSGRSHLTVVK